MNIVDGLTLSLWLRPSKPTGDDGMDDYRADNRSNVVPTRALCIRVAIRWPYQRPLCLSGGLYYADRVWNRQIALPKRGLLDEDRVDPSRLSSDATPPHGVNAPPPSIASCQVPLMPLNR
jgi:hypothetical protein